MSSSRFEALHARLQGDGPSLMVFSHGFGCDRHIWRDVEPALSDRHRTLVFDHAGSGASVAAWDPLRHAGLEGHAQDLLALIDEVAGPGPVTAVGHSVGSVIVLLAALARPERFARLVLLAPSPCFVNHPPDYVGGFSRQDVDELLALMESNHFGWAEFLAPLAMGQTNPMTLTRDFEQALCSLEPRIARHFARLAFLVDIREQLADVRVPCEIVQCTHDSLAPPDVGRWMHARLAGSRLHEWPLSGHCPHVSHPQRVVDLLRSLPHG